MESCVDRSPCRALPKSSVLSDLMIEAEMKEGNVIIHPFSSVCLSNCSYDVTLGEWYYRNTEKMEGFNPWCEEHVHRFWGNPVKASTEGGAAFNFAPGVRFISLAPGETILGHTREFLGGRGTITTMMKARSSLGRSCVAVCKCAGWGDIGYINRWTMEITNLSITTSVVLPVGARVAQIVFIYAGPTRRQYVSKYQMDSSLSRCTPDEAVKRMESSWTPESMLPKLWLEQLLPC